MTLTSSIDELTTKISTSEKELADATGLRDKEHEVFSANLLREAVFAITFWLSACEFSLSRLPTNLHVHIRALFFYGVCLVVLYCARSFLLPRRAATSKRARCWF